MRRTPVLALTGLLLVVTAIALWGLLRPRTETAAPLVRSVLKLPAGLRVQTVVAGHPLALSPDATTLVYGGTRQLFVRRLDQLDPVPLANSQYGAQPFFSPDGQHVGFIAEGRLKRVALAGGPAVNLCPAQGVSGATWGSREVIVFSAGGRLFQVPASGGTARPVVLADTGRGGVLRWPEFLPDGNRILVTAGYVPSLETVIVDLETGRVTPVPGAGTNARYVGPGSLLSFGPDGSGMVLPFDWRRGQATGPATPVLEGLAMGLQGVAKLAASQNGWVVYVPAASLRRRLALVDRRGAQTMLASEARAFSDPRFSPDGQQVAVTSLAPGGGLAGDIWVFNLKQATLSRLTFEGRQQFPEWSPDGRRVVFAGLAGSGAMHWIPAGGGEMDSLHQTPGGLIFEGVLSRDQRNLVYRLGGIPGDLYHVRRDSHAEPRVLVASPFDERAPALSPDDRWLAYVSNETGRDEIYVRPYPGPGGRWLVSAAGGTEPRWRRDGRELFYRNADTLFAVQVLAQPEFAAGQRTTLFTGDYLTNSRHATYDVHPNGQQFIFITGDPDDAGELILVQNLVSTAVRRDRQNRNR